jgi:hypothetical protein
MGLVSHRANGQRGDGRRRADQRDKASGHDPTPDADAGQHLAKLHHHTPPLSGRRILRRAV